jgi:hypothetical protein
MPPSGWGILKHWHVPGEQQGSVAVLQVCPDGVQGGGPPLSIGIVQHSDDCCPQLSMQFPLHVPFGTQHWPPLQTPDEHVQLVLPPQPSGTVMPHWLPPDVHVQLIAPPHPSETLTPHWLPQLLVGVQQLVW